MHAHNNDMRRYFLNMRLNAITQATKDAPFGVRFQARKLKIQMIDEYRRQSKAKSK